MFMQVKLQHFFFIFKLDNLEQFFSLALGYMNYSIFCLALVVIYLIFYFIYKQSCKIIASSVILFTIVR